MAAHRHTFTHNAPKTAQIVRLEPDQRNWKNKKPLKS